MNDPTVAAKGCGPQLCPSGSPRAEWAPDQLRDYSQSQYQAILEDERTLAVTYWRLGAALNLLRESSRHGQWQQFLGTLGIDKTRASKARVIARTFADEDQLAGLTVQEAYRRRRRNEPSDLSSDRDVAFRLRRLLVRVAQTANRFMDLVDIAEPDVASEVQAALDSGIADLERLRALLNR